MTKRNSNYPEAGKVAGVIAWFAAGIGAAAYFAALLAFIVWLTSCGPKSSDALCTAYEGGRIAACAACSMLPEKCPFEATQPNERKE